MSSSDEKSSSSHRGEAAALSGADASHFIRSAYDFIRSRSSADGNTSATPSPASQKAYLREWAARLGLELTAESILSKLKRGGQEHDLFYDEARDRYVKVTRDGIFGLHPGLELDLVSEGQEARRFHLWEATPLEYLDRLILQNELVPGITNLEGIVIQADELSIVTSQPRFEAISVTQSEIDAWFSTQGFIRIADAAYYREGDNLAVLDAHAKNVMRFDNVLVPFDVIPCRPSGGFLAFINESRQRGDSLKAVRTVSTENVD